MTYDEQKSAHLARLRELQRRYNACEESGNSDGADAIQVLIDKENQRWEQIESAPVTTGTK